MKDTEINNQILREIGRLVDLPHENWQQSDYESVYLFLGMLAGRIHNEIIDVERGYTTNTCRQCFRLFKAKYKNKVYCSDKCKSKAYRERQ